ncbi:isoprenyl transferase [bacterium]|nr:isoprenyl transferase [bacterium]
MAQDIKNQILAGKIPEHIAMIMDGNGRWAQEKGMDRIFGHHQGVETVRRMVEACSELGVKYLTLYAFSTENWARPIHEVNALMELLVSTLRAEVEKLNKNNVRLHTIGRTHDLPGKCQDELDEAIAQTQANTGLNLVLALSYSSKWDIANAAKKLAEAVEAKEISPGDIDEEKFRTQLSTCNFPEVELLIRTSGENRISNFLLWELAYAELYFTKTHWPDFNEEGLHKAIHDFQNRERRFGKTSEQIKNDQ